MNLSWTAKDIRCGNLVARGKTDEHFMLGYVFPVMGGPQHWCMISMADGNVFNICATREELAGTLSNGGYLPIELFGDRHFVLSQHPWGECGLLTH